MQRRYGAGRWPGRLSARRSRATSAHERSLWCLRAPLAAHARTARAKARSCPPSAKRRDGDGPHVRNRGDGRPQIAGDAGCTFPVACVSPAAHTAPGRRLRIFQREGVRVVPPLPPPRRAVLRTAPRMKLPEKRVEVLGYEARRAPWPLAAPCGPTGMRGDALAAMRGPRRGLRRSDHPVAVSPPLPATLTDMTCSPCCSLHVARGAVARALPSARRPR